MPIYSDSEIDHIIDTDEFKKLYRVGINRGERAWVTVLWLTGGRVAEVLELTKKDIVIEPDKISFKVVTKKLKHKGKFIVRRRTLILHIDENVYYIQLLKNYLRHFNDDDKIFQFCKRTGQNIIKRMGYIALGIGLCPNNFRHTRMTLLTEAGASEEELKRFKGSFTTQSVRPYLHARKIDYEVEVEV
jgi:integrase